MTNITSELVVNDGTTEDHQSYLRYVRNYHDAPQRFADLSRVKIVHYTEIAKLSDGTRFVEIDGTFTKSNDEVMPVTISFREKDRVACVQLFETATLSIAPIDLTVLFETAIACYDQIESTVFRSI